MCMYLGTEKVKFTGRGRVVLPRQVRKLAGNRIVLKRGLDGCVEGYSLRDWKKESEKLSEVASEDRFKLKYFFASSQLIELDNQGRFVIPPNMLEFGKIKEAVIIGVGDHFEIWDLKLWQKHIGKARRAYG